MMPSVPEHHRLSVPGPGRTIASVTQPMSAQLRNAAEHLMRGVQENTVDTWASLFGISRSRGFLSAATEEIAAWAVLGMWTVEAGVAKVRLPLLDAEGRFFGDLSRPGSLVNSFATRALNRAEEALGEIPVEGLAELLPYVLDRHGPGTRKSVMRNPSDMESRRAKKDSGVFYTPADVADYMVALVGVEPPGRTIDPACGTGAFLLAMLRRLAKRMDVSQALAKLHGVDVDPFAVQAAAFVLTSECLQAGGPLAGARYWRAARLNLTVRDALTLPRIRRELQVASESDAVARKADEFQAVLFGPGESVLKPRDTAELPELREGFDSVVANPPYARLDCPRDVAEVARDFETLSAVGPATRTNTFMPFMELMWMIAGERSRSSMIVPMSVAYGSDRRSQQLRASVRGTRGAWTFRFFDRTPDSVFGDDVKQRVAIVLRDATNGASSIQTSGIYRWSSRERPTLFRRLPATVHLPEQDISTGIPKLGTPNEVRWYRSLQAERGRLGHVIGRASRLGDHRLAVGATAYNWLVIYRDAPDGATMTDVQYVTVPTGEMADWLYAVLASRLTYWLWRVEGDGFHVTRSFISRLPYVWSGSGRQLELSRAGRALWERARSLPVESVNSGRRTISYRIAGLPELTWVDSLTVQDVGLSVDVVGWLTSYVDSTIAAGRGRDG